MTLAREEQIYRIDHYLGKDMIRNILTIRFSNRLFTDSWNGASVERVDVTSIETSGVEERLDYYDRAGAINDVKNLGYQTAANVNTIVTGKGYQTAAQVDTIVTGKGYQTAANVDSKVNAAKTELQNSLGSAFRAKGSTAFASLPAPASATKGDVWNITDQFTTTDQFVDGSGKTLPAGTNVVAVAVTFGWRWYRYVTNTVSPYDEVGIELNSRFFRSG